MTNSSRNTLVLASLLVFTGIVSFGILNRAGQKLQQKQQETQEIQTQIDDFSAMVANREALEKEYQKQMAMASQQSKVILQTDNSAISYDYLLQILKWLNKDLIYDFALSDQTNEYNEYVISGRSHYMDIVHFVRLLEYQRALLTIEDLTLTADSAAHSDTVSFSMIFRTHYEDDGVPISELGYKSIPRSVASYSLFRPKYTETLPEMSSQDPRLVDIDNSTLIALSEDRAFVRDSRGLIRILTLHDEVLWGYLYKIDHREGAAIFKVNKYGFEENQILYLSKGIEE
nr:hypothetical protein [Candidatus Cloacimonadota bacterium]